MADGSIIQTANLEQTFSALKNQDPARVLSQQIPNSNYYKPIPSQNLAPTVSVTGFNRYASASGNAGIVYGQPQFFSPVHTPINWQIPSKRLEEYQWMYLPNTQILTEDFTYNTLENTEFACSNIIDDEVTGGFIFEAGNYPKIMNSEGTFNQPPRLSMRDCKDKRCFSFKPIGNYRPIRISEEHYIFVLDGERYRKNRKIIGDKKYRSKKGIKPNGVEKVKLQNKLIKRIQAHEVVHGDYLLTPIPKTGTVSLDKDLAWAVGFCVADGCIYSHNECYSVKFTGGKNEEALVRCKEILESNFDSKISSKPHGDGNGWRISVTTKEAYAFFRKYIINKGIEKKFTKDVFDLDEETRLNILAGYFDGDGCYEKTHKTLVANCYSRDLADQIYWLLISCQINSSIGMHPLCDNHYPTSSECYYRIIIPSSQVLNISSNMNGNKVSDDFVPKKERALRFFYTEDDVTYLAQPIDEINEFLYSGKGFDIEMTNERHALVADGYVCSNSRFFYSNEPKVASAMDFYSYFPMNDFENECKDRKVKKYFDRLKKRLELPKWLRLMSHEIHLLGDCFPFVEVSCPICGGAGRTGDELCEHEGGTIRRIVILNPDFIEVFTTPMNPEPLISLRPDEELINMVQRKTPGYDRLTPQVRAMIAGGRPIPLDNRSVSHLKYGESGYGRFGIGMVRRLFPILSYKTKLMVAQWIVAERLIVPIKIVKVGSDERPAGPADIAAVQAQLSQTSNDPNLTIVTHHAFEIDFIGACHDDKTEILTKNGWKKFQDATVEDEIGTYNINNGRLEYQSPTEKQEYKYSGKMIEFFGRHVDSCVTPNHMMLVSKMKYKDGLPDGYKDWDKIRADEVSHNDRFVHQISWEGVVSEDLPYKNTLLGHLDLDLYLEFIGYYLAEGGVKINYGSPDAIHLTQKVNSEYYDRMKQLMILVKDNVKISQTISKLSKDTVPIAQIIINSRNLAKEMIGLYGHKSNGKFIPEWIKNLPCEKLKILFDAMMNGDGTRRFSKNGKLRLRYNTISKQMADDFCEISIKLGYGVSISRERAPKYKNYNTHDMYRINICLGNEGKYRTIKKKNIREIDYVGLVYCFTVPNGYIVTRRNGKIGIHGNSGKVLTLSNEFEFINQEILDGMMINNALLNGEGPNFGNAAVGIEAMIERLETFRREIANWIEQKIYLPEAKRQGFIDEDATEDDAEDDDIEYIYPKIKWNSMHLRDQQQFRTFVLQLYEKGLLSAQTVLESFDFNPDQEIERKRYDAVQMAALGQGLGEMGLGGQPGGGAGGGMGGGFGGGGGGLPGMGGGDVGGLPGMPGGEGGDAGGAPIAAPGGEGGAAPAMATSMPSLSAQSQNNGPANPANYGGKILKQKSRERMDAEKQKTYKPSGSDDNSSGGLTGMRDAKGRIVFTKPERELLSKIAEYRSNGLIRYPVVPQYEVKFGNMGYPIDFALPHLKIGIEADGETFHSSPKQVAHDKQRDMKLSQVGWTILRFTDSEIEGRIERVLSTIMKTIMQKEAVVERQKASLPE